MTHDDISLDIFSGCNNTIKMLNIAKTEFQFKLQPNLEWLVEIIFSDIGRTAFFDFI